MKTAYMYLAISVLSALFAFKIVKPEMEAKRVKYEQTVETKIWIEVGATKAEKVDLGDHFAKMTDTEKSWSEVRFVAVLYGVLLAVTLTCFVRLVQTMAKLVKEQDKLTAAAATATDPTT